MKRHAYVMTMILKLSLLVITAISVISMSTFCTQAEAIGSGAGLPFLDTMFTDNMVLQRGQSDPVWGWTLPGRSVTVRVAGKSATAVARVDGKWIANLPPLPVGGPYTLTVSGPEMAVLDNVLVGDVWVCSGQSNMEFGIGNGLNADKEFSAGDYPQIRLFWVPRTSALDPTQTTAGQWSVCTPENLRDDGDWGGFSAVAYFFGRDLYQDIKVPIGIIHNSWGGTPAEAWVSEPALRAAMPDFDKQIDALDVESAAIKNGESQDFPGQVRLWYADNDPGSLGDLGWADPNLDDSKWKTMNLPCLFQQAGDPEIAHVNGVMWFRRTFDVPPGQAGKDLVLKLMVDDNDTTWVNGVEVGATVGYLVPRAYDLPASLLKPTGNVIAVRDLDTGGSGGIWGDASGLALAAPDGTSLSLAGLWKYKLGVEWTKTTPYPTSISENAEYPTVLFNGMINPIIPYGIKGFAWYQGESNVGRALQYRTLLPAMIEDWRTRWGDPKLPFLIVQIAPYNPVPALPGDDATADLREAQWLTARKLKNTGIVATLDIGDPHDIHPHNKQEVGRRLALLARQLAYHEKVEAYGPVYRSMSISGSKVTIRFTHLGGGFVTSDGGAPKGFAVAGRDRHWYWADATIVGDTIVVSSAQVPDPTGVRYAWSPGPVGNVAARNGLPMFQFRSDDYPAAAGG
jgi:sialate O-acetylesterase